MCVSLWTSQRGDDMNHKYRIRLVVGMELRGIIDADNNRRRPLTMEPNRKPSRWHSGTCSICGEWSEFITQEHAHRHGFKSPEEMAKSGCMRWTGF